MYHKISVLTLDKKSWKKISPFHAVQISGNGGAFSMAQYYPREVISLWGYDGPQAQLYPGTGQTLPQTTG